MTIQETFAELSGVIQELKPAISPYFLPPPGASEVADAESNLGISFPDDLRQLYEVVNGQDFPAQEADPIFPCMRFHEGTGIEGLTSATWLNSVAELVDITGCHRQEYDDLQECAESFNIFGPARYHDNVIGFTSTENSDSLILGLDPMEGGTVGQVVMVRTQPFEIAVLAPSLSAFLTDVLEGHRSGRFAYRDHWGWSDR